MQSAHSNHSNVGHIYQRFITVELNRRFRKRKAFYVRSRVEEFWEPNGSSEHHKENQAEREGNANSNGLLFCSGLDNSGKTTIVLKINGEDTSVISPTLGFNIKTITYQKYTLNIWDVGGQKTIRSYWRNYFEQTDGLVWVVDSSDLRRLDDCKFELDNLLKEERLSGASLLILANKQDIKGALTPEEIAKVLNLEAMDKSRHWQIVGCSAYTGEGLLEGFDWLVQDIASRIYMLD
ncbi:ADP-ribosylation factor-like protein 2 [Glycine max]|uniref:ADP-ribosylation factor-like protein 2 n=1 Tax=Glycine soja TaxID=3848 RepID=A0A445HYW7_GLYSO|nr:ADP-ribosylation factor-like protein isoform X1 [Glycine max]XP_028187980.1 ADP-ribosylation factor-like protein 2 isoform X1 [Glycine soja]KAH1223922.1 ADP-ribosylation factor-like protein 2 [Glycine max]RZB78704.1 ADP-ribosylation factor-like protein 2 isoform B [Glycine soja]|eukprot:XP_014618955.1 ADP-ribosylation factor-like protein isoform X1 [Glycine max]